MATAGARITTAGTIFHVQLPNADLSSNGVVVAFTWDSTPTVTSVLLIDGSGATVDTLTLIVSGTSGNSQKYAAYGKFGCTAGAVAIKITLSTTSNNWSACAVEFFNCATASATDGSHFASQTAGTTAYQSGSITTLSAGDLILQFTWQDEALGWYGTSFTPDTGATLLCADLGDGMAAQYLIQGSAGAINPTLTRSPGAAGASITVAIKNAAAGTAPTITPRIVRHQDYTVASAVSSYVCQFPGNNGLFVVVHDGYCGSASTHCRVTGITDTIGNAWVSRGTASQLVGASGTIFYDEQIIDAVNATGSNSNKLTVSLDNPSGGSTLSLFDVAGAATAPFDNCQTAIGQQSTGSGAVSTVSITPATANGLVFATINQDQGTTTSCTTTGAIFDTPWYDAESGGFNALAEDKGIAHVQNANTSAITFVWRNTVDSSTGVNAWAAIAAAYKAPATSSPANDGPPYPTFTSSPTKAVAAGWV
jgi:hypothetical protein